MREDITTIPVTEIFEAVGGCPVCRMRDALEARVVETITGPAMMEPDVRIETNRQGFCHRHYAQTLARRNRLGVALMLQTRLAELDKTVFTGPIKKSPGTQVKSALAIEDSSCFVCRRVDAAMEKQLATVCRAFEQERDFRELFARQEGLCLPHFAALGGAAEKHASKRWREELRAAASALCRAELARLRQDVDRFCRMFDYRSGEGADDFAGCEDAIERGVAYLTSRDVK